MCGANAIILQVLEALHHAWEAARPRLEREGLVNEDRTFRWLAYKSFTYWIHKSLGIGKRLEIPACVQRQIFDVSIAVSCSIVLIFAHFLQFNVIFPLFSLLESNTVVTFDWIGEHFRLCNV
jgi:hypothetical protein